MFLHINLTIALSSINQKPQKMAVNLGCTCRQKGKLSLTQCKIRKPRRIDFETGKKWPSCASNLSMNRLCCEYRICENLTFNFPCVLLECLKFWKQLVNVASLCSKSIKCAKARYLKKNMYFFVIKWPNCVSNFVKMTFLYEFWKLFMSWGKIRECHQQF